jgi:hypothetical protein
MAPKNGSLI